MLLHLILNICFACTDSVSSTTLTSRRSARTASSWRCSASTIAQRSKRSVSQKFAKNIQSLGGVRRNTKGAFQVNGSSLKLLLQRCKYLRCLLLQQTNLRLTKQTQTINEQQTNSTGRLPNLLGIRKP